MNLARHMYGCRVIQKAIECLPQNLQANIISEIEPNVIVCVKDQNGNHVIQKCIECIDKSRLDFIISPLKGHITQLSVLIIDQFGNYVVQHILEHCPEDRDVIIKYMCAQIFPMSKHKFASNVAERCLLSANEEQKSALIEAFLYSSQGSEPENITSVNASSSTVFMAMKDQ